MRGRMARDVLWSQCAFFAFLLVGIVLLPGFLFRRNEGGLSNLGVHLRTVVPYTCAFAFSAFFVFRAAGEAPSSGAACLRFARLLYALGMLLVLVLVSTWFYKRNGTTHALHVTIAVIAVCFETAMSTWLVVSVLRDWPGMLVLACQCAGFVLAACTFAGWLHVLFVAQLVTSASFGILVVRSARRLDPPGVA